MAELIFNAILFVFFVIMLIISGQITIWRGYVGARYWPMTLLVAVVILLAINIYKIMKKDPFKDKISAGLLSEKATLRFLAGVASGIAYAFILPYLGFMISSIMYGMVLSWLLGAGKLKNMVLASVGVCIPIYAVFVWALDIILPRGAGIFFNFSIWLEMLL